MVAFDSETLSAANFNLGESESDMPGYGKRRLGATAVALVSRAASRRAEGHAQADQAIATARSIRLSPRQCEALQWAAQGKTDREVAAILAISEKGVKFHIAEARHKLDAANRTHAVAKALSFGLIKPVA